MEADFVNHTPLRQLQQSTEADIDISKIMNQLIKETNAPVEILKHAPLQPNQQAILATLKEREQGLLDAIAAFDGVVPYNMEWRNIAVQHVKEATMAAVRSVTRPDERF